MLKKSLLILTAVITALGLAACGETEQPAPAVPVETVAETQAATTAAKEEETTDKSAEADKKNDDKEKETTIKSEDDAESDAEDKADDKTDDRADEDAQAEEADEEEEAYQEDTDDVVGPNTLLDDDYYGTVYADGEGLLLRSGPDTGYEGLVLVPDGTDLDIVAEEDGWGYTNYGGFEGWVYLGYVG